MLYVRGVFLAAGFILTWNMRTACLVQSRSRNFAPLSRCSTIMSIISASSVTKNAGSYEYGNELSGSIKGGYFLTSRALLLQGLCPVA